MNTKTSCFIHFGRRCFFGEDIFCYALWKAYRKNSSKATRFILSFLLYMLPAWRYHLPSSSKLLQNPGKSRDSRSEKRHLYLKYKAASQTSRKRGYGLYCNSQTRRIFRNFCANQSGRTICIYIPFKRIFFNSQKRTSWYQYTSGTKAVNTPAHGFRDPVPNQQDNGLIRKYPNRSE